MGSKKLVASATSYVPGGDSGSELQVGDFRLPCKHATCPEAAAAGSCWASPLRRRLLKGLQRLWEET